LWADGSRVFSAKEGAGLWFFDEPDPHGEHIAVEWIDRSDPGCSCTGCCPPQDGPWPYPPAVFVDAGIASQGRAVVLGQDRNTAVAEDAYLMVFEERESSGEYECLYSDPLGPSDAIGGTWGGNMVAAHGDLLFASLAARPLRLYQHCPTEAAQVRFLGEIASPVPENGLEFADVAVYEEYLLVAEVYRPPLAVPARGAIHVYRWAPSPPSACPDLPALPEYLGSFCTDRIPYRLLVDPVRDQLYVGCTTKPTFPILEGDLLVYSLGDLNPDAPEEMDDGRTSIVADATIRVTPANVHDILLNGDTLYVADRDNGIYQYALDQGAYVGFYPAHRGSMSQSYVPQMVQSPDGVVPVYHPVALALTPSNKLFVQEHVTGRVSILSGANRAYLPLVRVQY
jgi:hypothetical protein